MAALECTSVLQAWMPSYHVWSILALPARPQFPNQEPLRPQQLFPPDFAMMPHLGHTELMVVVVTASVHMWTLVKTRKQPLRGLREDLSIWCVLALDLLRLQASTP